MVRAVEILAGAVRFGAACVMGFFVFTILALGVHRTMVRAVVDESSVEAVLVHAEFDERVLASLTRRALAESPQFDSEAIWAHRPPLRGVTSTVTRATHLPTEPRAFIRAESGAFAYARRGVFDVLPIFLGGLVVVLAFAGISAAARAPEALAEWRLSGRVLAALAILAPLAFAWRSDIFHDRTALLGGLVEQTLFVAAFVAAAARAAARSGGPPSTSVAFVSAVQGRPAIGLAVREAIVHATHALRTLVPTLAVAAVFVRAKADLSVASVENNGLALLIVRTVRATSQREQWVNAVIFGLALLLLTALGEFFLTEVRRALSPPPRSGREGAA